MHNLGSKTIRTRRSMVILASVSALALMLSPIAAQGGAQKDFVNGGFTDHFGENVGVHAQSGPSGQDPSGRESATRPGDTRYRLKVVCLVVQGNVAAYGTVIVKSNNPSFPVGFDFVEVVRDGGLPGGEGDGWEIFDHGAQSCGNRINDAAAAPDILGGNIHINDA